MGECVVTISLRVTRFCPRNKDFGNITYPTRMNSVLRLLESDQRWWFFSTSKS